MEINNGIILQFGNIYCNKKHNNLITLTLAFSNTKYVAITEIDDMEANTASAGYSNIYSKTITSFMLRDTTSSGNVPSPDYRTYIAIGY